jgi:hypothetical protein
VQEFLKIQSDEVVIRMEKMLKKEKSRLSENEFYPMTSDEFNARIDKSLLDSSNGNLTENSDLIKEIQRWI